MTDVPLPPGVRVERDGPVTTVALSRPHAPNAMDGPTAVVLHRAFRQFGAAVTELWGEGGTFGAGAGRHGIPA
jgi:enoyl-CoA hydratase